LESPTEIYNTQLETTTDIPSPEFDNTHFIPSSKELDNSQLDTTSEASSSKVYQMDDGIPSKKNIHLLNELVRPRKARYNIDKIINKNILKQLSDEDTKQLIVAIANEKAKQDQEERSNILLRGAINSIKQIGGLSTEMPVLSDSPDTIEYKSLSDFEPIQPTKSTIFIGSDLNRKDNIINKIFNSVGIQFLRN
jgi:hypothetical protein